MKTIELTADKLVVPGERELHSGDILREYYSAIKEGKTVKPVIVASRSSLDMRFGPIVNIYGGSHGNISPEVNDFFRRGFETGATHYLLDGNHRSIAGALHFRTIQALQIENEDDFNRIRESYVSGRFESFAESLKKLKDWWARYLAEIYFSSELVGLDESEGVLFERYNHRQNTYVPFTQQQRVEWLLKKEKLPYDIDEEYQKEWVKRR